MALLSNLEESTQSFAQSTSVSRITLGNELLFDNRWDTPLSGRFLFKRKLEITSPSIIILHTTNTVSLDTWHIPHSSRWRSRDRISEVGYHLNLNLQNLLMARWEARSAQMHGLSYFATSNVLGLTELFRDFSQVKGILEQANHLLASSRLNVQPLEEMYTFREATKIYHFLEANSFLVPLLREAVSHIRNYFPSSRITLEVVADPETTEEEQLVIFIQVDSNTEQATESLDKLDEEWWLDALDRAKEKLCITLEFL